MLTHWTINTMTIIWSSWSNPNIVQYNWLFGDCSAGNHQFILPFQTSIKKCVVNWNINRYNIANIWIFEVHNRTIIISDACIKAWQNIGYSGFPKTLADAIQLFDSGV